MNPATSELAPEATASSDDPVPVPAVEREIDAEAADGTARPAPALSTVFALAAALVGVGIGAQRLGDNSFLTHLATGRVMLDDGIVREDVFTWTSAGESLTVQSWAASLLFGVVDEIAGFHGLRILMAILAGVLGFLVWQSGRRADSLLTRTAIMVPVFVIGVETWSERPLLVAFVAFTATLVLVERGADHRFLVPIGFVWISVHGSWPLGLVLLGARWIGSMIDGRTDGAPAGEATRQLRAMIWLGTGMVVGGIVNPYGPRLLFFPLELLGRQEVLQHVAEWKASGFQSTWTRLFLVMVAAAVFAARRAPYVLVVPSVVFVVAALLSARNIPLASMVLVPMLAAGLPAIRGLDGRRRSDANRLAVLGLGVLLVALPLIAVRGPHVELDRYPVDAVNAMEDELDLSPTQHRVVHQDFVGNYLDLRYGAAGASWIDDRFELHDLELVEDYLALLNGTPEWRAALARHDPDAILWPADRVLVELALADGWETAWSDDDWVVLVPAAASN
ncbi:MAG: hypothetical protein AAGA90_19290 [Actinomycetota bacterium]